MHIFFHYVLPYIVVPTIVYILGASVTWQLGSLESRYRENWWDNIDGQIAVSLLWPIIGPILLTIRLNEYVQKQLINKINRLKEKKTLRVRVEREVQDEFQKLKAEALKRLEEGDLKI